MERSSEISILYREFLHTDFVEYAEDCLTLVRPVMLRCDCRQIGSYSAILPLMRAFAHRTTAIPGKNRVVSVSIGYKFPDADGADVSGRIPVVANGAQAQADPPAIATGAPFVAMRGRAPPEQPSMNDAICATLRCDFSAPCHNSVVVIDPANNVGGARRTAAQRFIDFRLNVAYPPHAVGRYGIRSRYLRVLTSVPGLAFRTGGKIARASGQRHGSGHFGSSRLLAELRAGCAARDRCRVGRPAAPWRSVGCARQGEATGLGTGHKKPGPLDTSPRLSEWGGKGSLTRSWALRRNPASRRLARMRLPLRRTKKEIMANTASARKRIRQTITRTARNHARKSRMRTFVRKVEAAIATGDKTAAADAFRVAQPEMQRASGKGVVHPNTIARKLSRLSARIKDLSPG
jgi:small subunit ribosomal protein S20